jgi:NDP-sugar pyrophosphorylase family protein
MALINDRPFLDLLINQLEAAGLRRFILCVGYMADFIIDYYRGKQCPTLELLISREPRPMGTAGAVKHAEPLIRSDSFLVMNGDSFCPADLNAFAASHREKMAVASMVLTRVEAAESYGTVVLGKDDRILQFREKSVSGKAWINAGIYLFKRDVLSAIPHDRCCSLERDIFPCLAKERFFGFITEQTVLDIGTPDRYSTAQHALMRATA